MLYYDQFTRVGVGCDTLCMIMCPRVWFPRDWYRPAEDDTSSLLSSCAQCSIAVFTLHLFGSTEVPRVVCCKTKHDVGRCSWTPSCFLAFDTCCQSMHVLKELIRLMFVLRIRWYNSCISHWSWWYRCRDARFDRSVGCLGARRFHCCCWECKVTPSWIRMGCHWKEV